MSIGIVAVLGGIAAVVLALVAGRRRAATRHRQGVGEGPLVVAPTPRKLPIYLSPEAQEQRPVVVPVRAPGTPARILVAEDDDAFRELVMSALARDGHQVEGVGDGWELCKRIEQQVPRDLPDLIVTDVRMPMLTGLEALGILRSSGVSVPVILMTAFGDAVTPEGARRLGATGVFDKPLDLRELRSFVGRVLEAPAIRPPPA